MLDGVLFFPVTPFAPDGALAPEALRAHVSAGVAAGAGAVFPACGTGEFHALSADEHTEVVRLTAEAVEGGVPVYAGVGGPLPTALALARAARDNGADGLLLLPPYLVSGDQAGLVRYVRQIAEAAGLPLIVYNRANARFTPDAAAEAAAIDGVVGFKDGVGDIETLARTVFAVRESLRESGKPFQFFNGLPTAEATVPAYRAIGVPLYSSAAFCFAPEISTAFHRAVTTGDDKRVDALLAGFFHPLVALRDKAPGYAVSLVKAGVKLRGLDAGSVRAPLSDPAPEDLAALAALLERGLDLVRSA
ncbi:5-dehydro-4-deoxyglucarate dehydratase [Streptomyces corynorhini]|uniref:Probable 5-dehydro-4-deoxyglucarate dehydratase n=2 Tax=Streptomyces corynorhini TaxID=2282652 RepID=A0A370B7F3_9ACTN|nr:5-dehydro-4-deoxyglucarate dehydratase [Streptomyces corynorhini]RDG37720.1 5-dehydro-4-deoxyglucarate dehydratase [Streptomyces corynorhini]